MALQTFLKRYVKAVAAGKDLRIPGKGDFIFVESASKTFSLQRDDGQRMDVKGRFKLRFAPDVFQALIVTNLSSTETLYFTIWIGAGDISYDEIVLPATTLVGQVVALADGASMDLPGVNASGQRRKQVTITLRPALAGRVEVYDDDNDTLLAIVAAASSGGGFAIETDANLRIKNKTGVAIASEVDPRDIAVSESWYL